MIIYEGRPLKSGYDKYVKTGQQWTLGGAFWLKVDIDFRYHAQKTLDRSKLSQYRTQHLVYLHHNMTMLIYTIIKTTRLSVTEAVSVTGCTESGPELETVNKLTTSAASTRGFLVVI